jgi:thiamine biosynthesis lipoprotein
VGKLCITFLAFTILISSNPRPESRRIHFSGNAQGTSYNITYYAEDTAVTVLQIDSLLRQIDTSLSIYLPVSVISRFNASDSGIIIDHHLKTVVLKSAEIYKHTGGLSDITIMPLTEAWGFGAKPAGKEPDARTIRTLLDCIGFNRLQLDNNFLRKEKPCVKIDVNGIAQGYTVDLLASLLNKAQVKNYLVELGGEIRVRGRKNGDQRMMIGVESPAPADMNLGIMRKVISIDSGAITTSGNYRKFYESKGKLITHLFNPRTGYSINNEMISATVYAADAMTADGYDNALMAMGVKKALKFLSDKNEIAAYFIYKDSSGNVRDTATAGFYKLIQR